MELKTLIEWLKSVLEQSKKKGYILGVSGGVDSCLLAKILEEGDLNFKLIHLKTSSNDNGSISFKELFLKNLIELEITDDVIEKLIPQDSKEDYKTNTLARIREIIFYNYAKENDYLVLGTINKVEFNIGYFVKNSSIGDVLPFVNLAKLEIRKLAKDIGLPENIYSKKASGCNGKATAEKEWGFTEDEAESFINNNVKNNKILKLFQNTKHKRKFPVVFSYRDEELIENLKLFFFNQSKSDLYGENEIKFHTFYELLANTIGSDNIIWFNLWLDKSDELYYTNDPSYKSNDILNFFFKKPEDFNFISARELLTSDYENLYIVHLFKGKKSIENSKFANIYTDDNFYNSINELNDLKSINTNYIKDYIKFSKLFDDDFIKKERESIYKWVIWNNLVNNKWTDIFYFNSKPAEDVEFIKSNHLYASIGVDKTSLTNFQLEYLNEFISLFKDFLVVSQSKRDIKLFRKNHLTHAIKSAISAIQSRNESHNIGSHVVSTLINGLFKPTDMQVFLKYMQERMDYSAQVSVDIPKWTVNTWFVGELLKDFSKQNLLLNNIVTSEKLDRIGWENQLFDIKVKIKDNDYKSIFTELPDLEDNDIQIAVPGGVTGNQAFYNIIENILRNVAKHGFSKLSEDEQENKKLEIYLVIKEKDDNYWLTISDNITKVDEKEVTIDKFEGRLHQSFIKSTGELIYENWGTAEIKIGAGYLNQKDYAIIGSGKKNEIKDFIEIKPIESEGQKEKYIGYKIKLPKPRKILIIDSTIDENNEKNGIAFKKNIENEKHLDYDFVINRNSTDIDTNKLPYRYLKLEGISDNDLRSELQTLDISKEFESKKLYNYWLNKEFLKNKEINLVVDLSGNEKPQQKHYEELQMLKFILKDPYFTEKGIVNKIKEHLEKESIANDDYSALSNFIYGEENINSDCRQKVNDLKKLYEGVYSSKTESVTTKKVKEGQYGKIELKNSEEEGDLDKTIAFKRHAAPNNGNRKYLEALSGSQSYFGRLQKVDDTLVYGLVEAALTKLCIIDERVADFQKEMEFESKFNGLNIKVFRDIGSMEKDDNIEHSEYILIIHQSIIDDNDILEEVNKKGFKKIYSTSGRGTPEKKISNEKDYKEIKYIPFANIQHTLLKPYPEKYILVQNLFKI